MCDFQTRCAGYNDIALISLKTPLYGLRTISTFSVENNPLSQNARNCSVAGFGNEGKILTESKAALYTYQECNSTLFKYLLNGYAGVMKLYPGNICAHPQTCNVMLKVLIAIAEELLIGQPMYFFFSLIPEVHSYVTVSSLESIHGVVRTLRYQQSIHPFPISNHGYKKHIVL